MRADTTKGYLDVLALRVFSAGSLHRSALVAALKQRSGGVFAYLRAPSTPASSRHPGRPVVVIALSIVEARRLLWLGVTVGEPPSTT